MADDIVAGFLAAIVVVFPAYVLVAMKLRAAQAVIEKVGFFVDEVIRSSPQTLLSVAGEAVQISSQFQFGCLRPSLLSGFIV